MPSFFSMLIVALTSNFYGRCFLMTCFGAIVCLAIWWFVPANTHFWYALKFGLMGFAWIPLVWGVVLALFGENS